MSKDVKKAGKEFVDTALDKVTDEASDAYYGGLSKIEGDHKPRVAKTRLFVAGAIAGAVVTAAIFLLLL